MFFGALIAICITAVLLQLPWLNYVKCSKTMVNLWLLWFNYSNHGVFVLFVVKPWLMFMVFVVKLVNQSGEEKKDMVITLLL